VQILQDVAQVYSIAVVITNKESPDELNWRINNTDIAALEGPPGCGKTTVGSALAIKLIAEGIAKRVLLVAYTNAAANEFGWELFQILGPSAANICVRTGNPTGVDPTLPIPFSKIN
jgi:SpoVK/Ycf46/Vps4 family AAA+-type ATPase